MRIGILFHPYSESFLTYTMQAYMKQQLSALYFCKLNLLLLTVMIQLNN